MGWINKGLGWALRTVQRQSAYRRLAQRLLPECDLGEADRVDLILVQKHFNPGSDELPDDSSPGGINYVARFKQKIIGFVQLVRHPKEDYPFVGYWLFSLNVWPLWRGSGIGEALTRKVIAQAVTEGAQDLFCLVRNDNQAALNLYGKLGFERWLIPALEEQLVKEWQAVGIRRVLLRKALP